MVAIIFSPIVHLSNPGNSFFTPPSDQYVHFGLNLNCDNEGKRERKNFKQKYLPIRRGQR